MAERISVKIAENYISSMFHKQKLVKPCHNCQLYKIVENRGRNGQAYTTEECEMGLNTYNKREICGEQLQRKREYTPTSQLNSFHDL